MSHLHCRIAVILLCLPAVTGRTQESRAEPVLQADEIKFPELRQELLERRERDQAIRNEVIKSGAERPDPKLSETMRQIDRENTSRMKDIVREHGWPGPELVGRDGTNAAWLIVQHSTPEFQKEMLPLVKEAYLAGKLRGSSYALLLDRVLVHEGKPQVYGSQGKWENGVLGLQPIEDEANVDKRRAEVGLGPLSDYLAGMREMYQKKSAPTAAAQKRSGSPTPIPHGLPNPDFARLMELERRCDAVLAAVDSNADEKDRAKQRSEASSLFQQLAAARSVVGDYEGSLDAFRRSSNPTRARAVASSYHDENAKEVVKGFRPLDAITAIVDAARDRQIVILNEAHHIARHRAFALSLAIELRKLGFTHLACETFSNDLDADQLRTRGYPNRNDGYYIREPLFGDFVRQSIKLGYIPVAYEHVGSRRGDRSPADSINERETGQAANLMERIFKENPRARVFIFVGYSHLMKKPQNRSADPSRTVQWMAGRLKTLTGIDPLTVDQVAMTDPEADSLHAAILRHIFADRAAPAASLLLRSDHDEKFLVLGSYANDADVQVFHAPTHSINGRPDWMAMNGYRTPRAIPAELIPASGRRLVQAFVEGETDAPIAVDQIVVEAGAETRPVFMLPAGKFRFSFEE